jgi:glucokinase
MQRFLNIIAIDIGGTNIRGASLTSALEPGPVSREAIDHALSHAELLERLVNFIVNIEGWSGVKSQPDPLIAIALPGVIDIDCQVIVEAVNLAWDGFDLPKELSSALSVQVRIMHDVRTALKAEMESGKLVDCKQGMLLSIGTGIAAGLIVDGRAINADGYAGEIGHVNVGSGIDCACGSNGCLETIASGRAIQRQYRYGRGDSRAQANDIARLAHEGDTTAREVWSRAIDSVAKAIAVACSLIGTEHIVIAGGVSTAGSLLVDPLIDAVTNRLSFQRMPTIEISRFGDLATLQGVFVEGLAYERNGSIDRI